MTDAGSTHDELRRALVQRLESLQRAGVSHVRRVELPELESPPNPTIPPSAVTSRPALTPPQVAPPPVAPNPVASALVAPAATSEPPSVEPPVMPKRPTAPRPAAPAPSKTLFESTASATKGGVAAGSPAADLSDTQRRVALDVIEREVRACTRCSELVANRTKTVFGVGNIRPRLVFFGEAPGADEDQQGEPFVGRAGQLLDKIIEACTLRREDVYIMNVLKCRPPGNRAPLEEETENCRAFFERQLTILRPEFIVCLGASAVKALLHSAFSIGKMRGRFYEYKGSRVVVTYHPAYLLRNPAAKKEVWEDMKMVMKEMGLTIPGP